MHAVLVQEGKSVPLKVCARNLSQAERNHEQELLAVLAALKVFWHKSEEVGAEAWLVLSCQLSFTDCTCDGDDPEIRGLNEPRTGRFLINPPLAKLMSPLAGVALFMLLLRGDRMDCMMWDFVPKTLRTRMSAKCAVTAAT